MDEGLFSLLFFGIFIVASIFDAVARSRRKKQRMEEMEREDGAVVAETEQGRPDEYPEREWEAPRRQPAEWEAPSGSTSESRSEPASEDGGAGERETADAMVPEDLWAVLTGQQRPSPRSEGPAPAGSSGRYAEDPPVEPRIPTPVPSDRYGAGRTPRWGGTRDRPAAIGAAEIGGAGRPEVRPAARAAGSMKRRAVSRLDDTISLHSSSRRRPSPYTSNLRSGGRQGLREAVVLSEVLGSPLALRPRDGGWDGEPS